MKVKREHGYLTFTVSFTIKKMIMEVKRIANLLNERGHLLQSYQALR